MAEEKYGFSLGEVSTAKHDMIILVDCHTGYCGEGNTEEYFVPAGTDLDALAHEMAIDNASRFGSDGYEDEETGEWYENENVYASLYHYQLSKSGTYVNGGDPINSVMKLIIKYDCRQQEVIFFDDESGNIKCAEKLGVNYHKNLKSGVTPKMILDKLIGKNEN